MINPYILLSKFIQVIYIINFLLHKNNVTKQIVGNIVIFVNYLLQVQTMSNVFNLNHLEYKIYTIATSRRRRQNP